MAAGVAAVAAFALVVRAVDTSLLTTTLRALLRRPGLLALITTAYTGAFVLHGLAWRALVPRGPGTVRLLQALLAGFSANHLLPLRGGEAVRVGAGVAAGLSLQRSAGSVLVNRLLDVGTLGLVALGWARGVASVFAIVAAAGAFSALLVGILVLRDWSGSSRRESRRGSLKERLDDLLAYLGELRAGPIVSASGITIGSWVVEGTVLWGVAGVSRHRMSFPVAAGITALTLLSQVLAVTPGGLGVYEGAMVGALAAVGVPVSAAAGLALLTHGYKYAYALAVAIPASLPFLREGVRSMHRSPGRVPVDG